MSSPVQLTRFLIEDAGVRGVLVHLDETWQQIRQRATGSGMPKRSVLGESSMRLLRSGACSQTASSESPTSLCGTPRVRYSSTARPGRQRSTWWTAKCVQALGTRWLWKARRASPLAMIPGDLRMARASDR